MNPDNPNFRTPEEEARAAELVRLKAEVASLKARLSLTNSNWPHEKGLHETIARQAEVIEKLKLAVTDIANKNTCWRLYEIDKYKSYEDGWEGVAEFAGKVLNELEAIEQQGEGT